MNSKNERQSAFAFWMRTGRRRQPEPVGPVEHKYNHWHDRESGQFTFANGGQYVGQDKWAGGGFSGGGGGSFGGGGATGPGWGDNRSVKKRTQPPAKPNRRPPDKNATPANAKPRFRVVSRNGYDYEIDRWGRTRRVSGNLTLGGDNVRSRRAQAQAGGADRRPGDDGGHYVAARFNGPTDAFNHFAQDGNFNRGRYRALEDQWARALKKGQSITVTIIPTYIGSSKRPSEIDVWFVIDGIVRSVNFPNEPKGTNRGKR